MTAPVQGDLKFFKTAFSNIAAENGGYLSTDELISGVTNNVFDHVLSADRLAGRSDLRKLALKIHQDGNGYLASARFGVETTLGDDVVRMLAMTARNFEDDLTGSERYYSGGILVNAITAGASALVVDVKHADCTNDIRDGDVIRLTDKYDPDATGNEEYLTVNAVPTVSGTQLTLSVAESIANSYAAYVDGSGGKVTAVLEHGTIQAGFDTFTQSRASGYDETTYPLLFNNMGADEDDITITFIDASTFSVSSARFGALASGGKSADYSPLHPTWNKILFTLEMAGWSGAVTHQAGDTITFTTHAAAGYVAEKRIVPANCSPLSNNRIILLHTSEGL